MGGIFAAEGTLFLVPYKLISRPYWIPMLYSIEFLERATPGTEPLLRPLEDNKSPIPEDASCMNSSCHGQLAI
jgi:hypothetical protein